MTRPLALLPSRRAVRRADALAAFVAVLSLALGAATGVELGRLTLLGTGLQESASALESAGHGLQSLSGVPLVGSQVAELADGVVTTAAGVRAGAAQATAAVRVLAVLIGLVVALIPAPVIASYVVFRARRARAVRELRRLLEAPDGLGPALSAQLAHRAVLCLPHDDLRLISDDPWRDLAAGDYTPLAAAELRRLGLTPHAERASGAGAAQPPRPAADVTHKRDHRRYQQ